MSLRTCCWAARFMSAEGVRLMASAVQHGLRPQRAAPPRTARRHRSALQPRRKQCAWIPPHCAPSVATCTGSGVTVSTAKPASRSRCADHAALIGKGCLRLLGQSGNQGGGQCTAAHIVERRVVQHEVGMAGAQQIEEVQPALRWPRAEPGDCRSADAAASCPPLYVVPRYRPPIPKTMSLQSRSQHVAGFAKRSPSCCSISAARLYYARGSNQTN